MYRTSRPSLDALENAITLDTLPFTDRGSRLLLFRDGPSVTFRVQLAEFARDAESRPPITAWQFTDGDGRALDGDVTTYPDAVVCTTSSGTFHITFADPETLLVALPPETDCGMTLITPMDTAERDVSGGELGRERGSPLRLSYTAGVPLQRNEVTALPDGLLRLSIGCAPAHAADAAVMLRLTRDTVPALGAPREFRPSVPDPRAALAASAARWDAWLATAPVVASPYRRHVALAWWTLAANIIRPYAYPEREGIAPSKLHYVGIWHWDSYFHAIALRHAQPELAKEQFRLLLDHQLPSGLIPDVVHDEGVIAHTDCIADADVTKPPLTAWAAEKVYEATRDRAFLAEVYGPAVRFQRWWFAESDPDGDGLPDYLHPWSSGLDNSPLWDTGLPVSSPDLLAYLTLQYDALARIARTLGHDEDARLWTHQAEHLTARLIAARWDEQAGLFRTVRLSEHGGQQVPAVTSFNLFPLITGRMPSEIAARLVAALTDPRRFWARWPVPTVARDDPAYDPEAMWRGPVWLNVNYLLIDGLLRAGYPQLARELRARTLEMVLQGNGLYEYYHPESGAKPPRATEMFSWTAALFIDLALAATNDVDVPVQAPVRQPSHRSREGTRTQQPQRPHL